MVLHVLLCGAIFAAILGGILLAARRYHARYVAHARAHFQDLFHEAERTRGLFLAVFHVGDEGRVAVNPAGEIVAINRRAGEFLKVSEKDFIKKPLRDLWRAAAPAFADPAAAEELLGALGTRRTRGDLHTESGSLIRVNTACVRNVMRQDVGTLYVLQDMTSVLHLEHIKADLLMELTRRLEKPLAQVRDALARASLPGGGGMERLREAQEGLTEIEDLGAGILKLAELRLLEDGEAGRASPAAILKTCGDKWEKKAKAKGLRFTLEVPGDLPAVRGRAARLGEIEHD